MSLEDRVKATAKNLEGKAQEALGEITGDPEQKLKGQKKQAEAQVQQSVENLKDKAKKLID
ncbi:MAG: CsbD family protein [Cyanobacteria bacterium J06592_8]